jgi:hypothetical protein
MKKILQVKHWQLFILIIICGAWVSPEPLQSIINGMAFATFFWWMYAIAVYGQQKAMSYGLKPLNLQWFRINFFFLVCVAIAGLLFPDLLAEESSETIGPADIPFIAFGLYLMIAFLQIMLFTCKTIARLTERREVTFGDYFVNLFLFGFLFVWIWILQPKLNRIFSDAEFSSPHAG